MGSCDGLHGACALAMEQKVAGRSSVCWVCPCASQKDSVNLKWFGFMSLELLNTSRIFIQNFHNYCLLILKLSKSLLSV